jgi:hypothetical protein
VESGCWLKWNWRMSGGKSRHYAIPNNRIRKHGTLSYCCFLDVKIRAEGTRANCNFEGSQSPPLQRNAFSLAKHAHQNIAEWSLAGISSKTCYEENYLLRRKLKHSSGPAALGNHSQVTPDNLSYLTSLFALLASYSGRGPLGHVLRDTFRYSLTD